ncbi:filamin-binding LIM protein 1 [Megalops cyprinoides]|uniref:filamin-binding LIM protein 1 n=1 Tax=Megalops cyprinoides TaxID=118141 RepID=UPI0018644FC8|nr:filamin-binding LIM protein 1 [Megalops cyprinoides]
MASAAPQKRMVSSVFITLATPHRATVTPSARRGSTHSAAQRDEHTATRASPRDGPAGGLPPAAPHDPPRDAPAPAPAASHTPSPSSSIPPSPTPTPLPPATGAPAGQGAVRDGSTEEFLPPPPPPPMAPDSELCTDLGPPLPPPPPLEPSTIIQPEPPLPVSQSEPIHSASQKGSASEQQPGERALPGGGNPNNPTERIQPGPEEEAEPESRDLCGFCRKLVALTDPAIEALNRTYHANCFQCRQCQVPLAGKMYYNKAGIPLCEDCYLASLEQCWACGEVIKDHVIRALGRAYHPACFICTTCSRPIGEERFAQGEVGEVYCLPDYYRKYAPQCSACQQLIIPSEDGKDSFTVECLGRSFHEDCYRCEICSISLSTEPNEQGCYPLDGRILCKPCHMTMLQEGHP